MSLPIDLLDRAKQLDVNISRASERGLREEVHEAEARAWVAQHADFIAELNVESYRRRSADDNKRARRVASRNDVTPG